MNLEISTVVGCKMNCDYCPQRVHVLNYTKKWYNTRMRLEDFKTMLSTVPVEVDIHFSGMAEPFLNPDCAKMIRHAHDCGHRVGIYTTTVGMKIEDIVEIHDIPFMFLTLHLPDKNGLMKLHVDEGYLKILSKVIRVFDCQYMVVGELDERVKEITGPVADHSSSLLSRAGNIKRLAIPKKGGVLQCSACGPKIDHNVVLPSGEVLICCMDYSQEHVIGNLLEMTYGELFTSDGYNRIMEGLKDENSNIICRTCEISKNV